MKLPRTERESSGRRKGGVGIVAVRGKFYDAQMRFQSALNVVVVVGVVADICRASVSNRDP